MIKINKVLVNKYMFFHKTNQQWEELLQLAKEKDQKQVIRQTEEKQEFKWKIKILDLALKNKTNQLIDLVQ